MKIRCHWWDFREMVEFRFPVISCHQTTLSPVTQRFRIDTVALRLQDAFVDDEQHSLTLSLFLSLSIFLSFSLPLYPCFSLFLHPCFCVSLSLSLTLFLSLPLSLAPTQRPLLSQTHRQQQPLSFRILGNDPVTPFYTYKHGIRLFSVRVSGLIFRTRFPGKTTAGQAVYFEKYSTRIPFKHGHVFRRKVSGNVAWRLFNIKNRRRWMCTFFANIEVPHYIGWRKFLLAQRPNYAGAPFSYAKIYITHLYVVLILRFVYM